MAVRENRKQNRAAASDKQQYHRQQLLKWGKTYHVDWEVVTQNKERTKQNEIMKEDD